MKKQSAHKIYTNVLENITKSIKLIKQERPDFTNNLKIKKMTCNIFKISLSTYNKYLKELKDGTYTPCYS